MNICIIAPTAESHSGIGRMVLNVGASFVKKGHHVGYITEYGDSDSAHTLHVRFNDRSLFQLVRNFFRVNTFARRYDVILCFDILPAGFFAGLVSLVLQKPLYIHCIGTYSLFSRSTIKNFFMVRVYQQARKIFVLSRVTRDSILETLPGFNLDKSVIIPPGAQTEFFYPDMENRPTFLPHRYLLTVGGVKSRKGHDISLEAFAKIAHRYPDLTYVIVGRFDRASDYAFQLEEILTRTGIKERVIFLDDPTDEELRKIYSHAEFFVMTSRTTHEFVEGFGIVYLEAGLCGVASIGALNTGAEDAILDNKTGMLVPLECEFVAEAMVRLLDDTKYRERLEREALIFAKQFTWEHTTDIYEREMQTTLRE